MQEILENVLYDWVWDDFRKTKKKTKTYHIYLKDETIYVDAPLPVRQLLKLKKILRNDLINYKNIIIGKPDI